MEKHVAVKLKTPEHLHDRTFIAHVRLGFLAACQYLPIRFD